MKKGTRIELRRAIALLAKQAERERRAYAWSPRLRAITAINKAKDESSDDTTVTYLTALEQLFWQRDNEECRARDAEYACIQAASELL